MHIIIFKVEEGADNVHNYFLQRKYKVRKLKRELPFAHARALACKPHPLLKWRIHWKFKI